MHRPKNGTPALAEVLPAEGFKQALNSHVQLITLQLVFCSIAAGLDQCRPVARRSETGVQPLQDSAKHYKVSDTQPQLSKSHCDATLDAYTSLNNLVLMGQAASQYQCCPKALLALPDSSTAHCRSSRG